MAYESLINQAKDYLKLDNSEFEEYYRKAAENLQNSYNKSLSLLEKQYTKDKNAAASQSMLNKRNMDQYLAARGLSRSGESVQEQINSNISLNNTLNSLADTNARQIAELETNKNADLLELEEKRLEHKSAADKWNAEQENKRREAAEEREYETMKIASQREYEDAVRKAEHELEAQIRAENARAEAEKAARDQEYKLEYYRLQQADKERLLKEERAYDEQQKKADREYEEAQKALEQEIKERLLAEERAYNDRVREQENKRKAEEEEKEREAKIKYYQMQQADKERLIAEERAYNESKNNANGASADSSPEEYNGLTASEKNYVTNMSGNIISNATGGRTSIKSTKERVAAYKLLQDLKSKGTPSKYLKAIEATLTSSGYTAPSDTEMRETALFERLDEIYDMAYKDTMTMMASQNISTAGARPIAINSAVNSQLAYLYKHCASLDGYYEMAERAGIDRNRAYKFILNQKKN